MRSYSAPGLSLRSNPGLKLANAFSVNFLQDLRDLISCRGFGPREAPENGIMTDKKGWASTVAGWFIERDEAEAPAAPDFAEVPDAPLPANLESYTTPSPTQSVFQTAPPPSNWRPSRFS